MPETKKLPAWYKRTSCQSAEIDLGEFAEGVVLKISDAPTDAVAQMIRTFSEQRNATPSDDVLIAAAWLKCYAADAVGDKRAEVFNSEMPKNAANIAEWRKWVAEIRNKPLTRMLQGIGRFHSDAETEGND